MSEVWDLGSAVGMSFHFSYNKVCLYIAEIKNDRVSLTYGMLQFFFEHAFMRPLRLSAVSLGAIQLQANHLILHSLGAKLSFSRTRSRPLFPLFRVGVPL